MNGICAVQKGIYTRESLLSINRISMPDFLYNNKLYYNPVEFAMDRIGGTWKMPILAPERQGDALW